MANIFSNTVHNYLKKGIAEQGENNCTYINFQTLSRSNFSGLIKLINLFFKDNDIDAKIVQEHTSVAVRRHGKLYYVQVLNNIVFLEKDEKLFERCQCFVDSVFKIVNCDFLSISATNSYQVWKNNVFATDDSKGYFLHANGLELGHFDEKDKEWKSLILADSPSPSVLIGMLLSNKTFTFGRAN